MPNGIAVSNTGPLIAFAKIGRLGLLTEVFSEVLIPKSVSDELQASDLKDIGSEALRMADFRVVECKGALDRLLQEIDGGEAAVIQIAIETGAAEVLLDDKKARRIASSVYHLNVLGTGGLLLRAKRRGLIKDVKPLFEAIRKNGYFVSERIVDDFARGG